MVSKEIYLGNTIMRGSQSAAEGEFVVVGNERFYRIRNVNQMPDFLISVVSDSDHWMYISSNGALSAGRKNRDNALFPYYTDDKIHDYREITGSRTWLKITINDKTWLWQPFSRMTEQIYHIERNLYKNLIGNKILFEEINKDLKLRFTYGWCTSEKYGFIKKSSMTSLNSQGVKIEVLDGLGNILPYGVNYNGQNEYSNLMDAYKRNELNQESGIAVFSMGSVPVDRAEPSEALKATTVWHHGFNHDVSILLSERQIKKFIEGWEIETEKEIRGARGAFYAHAEMFLEKEEKRDWMFAAELNQDHVDLASLEYFLKTEPDIGSRVDEDIEKGSMNLFSIVAKADGLQKSNYEINTARHYGNTLFNVMRGGISLNNYVTGKKDVILYVSQTNRHVLKKFTGWLEKLPEKMDYLTLTRLASLSGDPDLERICREYLPLTFSRRHGDPSRPWNRFSIETKDSDGNLKLSYEGNWRDIFQNWEALCLSFPEFTEGMICKFLNASTADGYNPYRITREGVDWEVPDPHDPWAYIGYWGDHQIIYLLKFLEHAVSFHPRRMDELLNRRIFVYTHVPYRIKSFPEIEKDPKETILFDDELHRLIMDEVSYTGADGRLLKDQLGNIYHVTLVEKILATLLSKLTNFIPGAGIWLNTQRPEWNDANNALVGNGVSMVTLYYLRRFLKFWEKQLEKVQTKDFYISAELLLYLHEVIQVCNDFRPELQSGFSDAGRYAFVRKMGLAADRYRNKMYSNSFSGNQNVLHISDFKKLIRTALEFTDQTISVNKRHDGLYHAYHLISVKHEKIVIRHLYEMLEGQVAVLSSGYLNPEQVITLLDALKRSRMFKPGQYSYMLYPDRELPGFLQKNIIPEEGIQDSKILKRLFADQDKSVIKTDINGMVHFNGSLRNAQYLSRVLDNPDWASYPEFTPDEKAKVLELYEKVFDHQSFTGRSGTFFGYEGLGSIYWHMVSKLLLAVQECLIQVKEQNPGSPIIQKMKAHYYEIKTGIGLFKTPQEYGAFPTDPYSHTPAGAGVKQPGMTGQVKEDFITRITELGVRIHDGKISFDPFLVHPEDFLDHAELFDTLDTENLRRQISLSPGQLGFTFCQVPVILSRKDESFVTVHFSDGRCQRIDGSCVGNEISSSIFSRNGKIRSIEVSVTF